MSFLDTLSLALGNLRQSKLRTLITVIGVAIGIGSLSCLVSLGVGLEEQLVGRLMSTGVFDSITVTTGPVRGMLGSRGRRGGGPAGRSTTSGRRGAETPPAPPQSAPTEVPGDLQDVPPVRLDDEAIAKIQALPNVKSVVPNLHVPVQVALADFSEYTGAAGVPMSSAGEGAFQTITHGKFFANDTDTACMLSLEMAKRISENEPKELIGKSLTLTYAIAEKTAEAPADATPIAGIPGVVAGMEFKQVSVACPIVGIVERESAPGMFSGSVSPLMIPLSKAKAIDAVQVTSPQAMLRKSNEPRGYNTVTVKVRAAKDTLDVEDKIKAMGYSAFSIADALQGAKRGFMLLDIMLALLGSIALVVSSLGIVNTMLMSILQRTREIGIMKAIGGSDGNIRKIFLIEASAIGVMGGIMGVALGWFVGRVANFGINWYIVSQGGTKGDLFSVPIWLVASAIGFSLLVSLLAGSYPARRAARLDPIQALRHD